LCESYCRRRPVNLSPQALGNKPITADRAGFEWEIQCTSPLLCSLSFCSITEEGYTALASALKSNPSSHLKELDLRGNDPGYSGVKMVIAILEDPNCKLKTLRLSNSSITEEGCAALSSAIDLNPSHLIELDLSANKLENSGINPICNLLNSKSCKLQRLRLPHCSITEEGYAALASALTSNTSSHLTDLDLRGNDPGDTGVKKLIDLLKVPEHKLKTLSLLNSSAAEEACEYLTEVLGVNPLLERELDLSGKIKGDSDMEMISYLLKDLHCRTQILKLSNSSITEKGCAALSSALCLNPSHLIELDLSENKLENSGVTNICSLLSNQNCKLQTLGLYDCKITEVGCAALTSALKSNPSHLIELDLSENEVGDAGVEKLSDLLKCNFGKQQKLKLRKCCITEKGYSALATALKSNSSSHLLELDLRENDPGDKGVEMITDPKCKLKTLRLLKSPDAEEAYKFLTDTVKINPLLQRDLDLSGKIEDSRVKQLTALLEDSHCRLQELRLNGNGITEESCAALASALHSNPLYLRKLDLSGNKVGKSGMEKLGILLESPKCELDKLGLSDCSITEEGWTVIVSAVEKNPAHLKDLDLSKNKIEGSGLDQVSTLLKNPNCVLNTLKLSDCHITGDGYAALALALKSNPSSNLKELDLRRNNPGDNGVEILADLLQDEKFKLETLRLLKSSEAEEACSSLPDVLDINPLLQTELDLKGKIQGDSQVKQLSLLLGDSHCRLRKLNLSDCRITGEGYAALASALELNPSSHLIELDLRGNDPGAIGVAQLTKLRNDPKYKLESLR
ncbi:hypothetical protein NFI96_031805, partial [Prochilodus magdalenae]